MLAARGAESVGLSRIAAVTGGRDGATVLVWLGLSASALLLGLAAGFDPKLAIGAALGLAFVSAVMSELALGLCLFTVLAFFEVLPAVAGGFTFAKIGGLLLAIAWTATIVVKSGGSRNFVTSHPLATAALVTFLAWIAISTAWAESPSTTLATLPRYGPNVFLFLIVYTAIRERRHVVWMLAAFVVGASVAAAYGIVRPPAQNPLRGDRIGGIVGDPNELASVLVVGLVLAVTLAAILRRRTIGRAMVAGCALLLLLGVFLTLSRGGLLALAVVMVVAVLNAGRWRAAVLVLAVLAAAGAVGYFSTFASPVARARVTTAGSGSGRTGLWTVGWRMVEAHPVRGVGAGNFAVSSVHYLLRPGTIPSDYLVVDIPQVAHNVYLQLLAETGVIGLALFLGIVAFAIACAIRAAHLFRCRGDPQMELVARAVVTAQAGILAADFFISAQYNKQLWILLALGAALLGLASETRAGARG
jgi:O-antigen ligase